MEAWDSIQSGAHLAPVPFNQPEAANRMGVGANPVGCTLGAPS